MKALIVGAGASGLSTIKCCLDEGLEVECFEQGEDIGGMWRYSEHEGHSSIYESTIINSSKEMSCFSDFPMPKEFAPFLPHYMMLRYYELYVERFALRQYIRFKCKVISVRRSKDHETTSKWEVIYQHCDNRVREERSCEYDVVFVCAGHLCQPRWPSFPGIEKFKGRTLHSHCYKNPTPFKDKTVLIVGLGNSAGDIAVDLSRHAKKVFVSTRKGALIKSRTVFGIPFDYILSSRAYKSLPSCLAWLLFEIFIIKHIDYKQYGLQTTEERIKGPFIINDDLVTRISTGTVSIKNNVAHFGERSVTFVDNTKIENLDVVIFCTGYIIGFDFLDPSIISSPSNNDLMLYKYIFPPREAKPTLAFIGYITIKGSMNPTVEMQARWVLAVVKGTIRLPSRDEMLREIRQTRENLLKQVDDVPRNALVADGVAYNDSLAQQIGCKPDLLRILISDPVFGLYCLFGPVHPAQYRLCGPGKWSGARKAAMGVYTNLIYPTMTRTAIPEARATTNGRSIGKVAKVTVSLFAIIILLICALKLDGFYWLLPFLIAIIVYRHIRLMI